MIEALTYRLGAHSTPTTRRSTGPRRRGDVARKDPIRRFAGFLTEGACSTTRPPRRREPGDRARGGRGGGGRTPVPLSSLFGTSTPEIRGNSPSSATHCSPEGVSRSEVTLIKAINDARAPRWRGTRRSASSGGRRPGRGSSGAIGLLHRFGPGRVIDTR